MSPAVTVGDTGNYCAGLTVTGKLGRPACTLSWNSGCGCLSRQRALGTGAMGQAGGETATRTLGVGPQPPPFL